MIFAGRMSPTDVYWCHLAYDCVWCCIGYHGVTGYDFNYDNNDHLHNNYDNKCDSTYDIRK